MSKYLKNMFFYHTPSYLVKNLYGTDYKIKNDDVIKDINNWLIELKKDINIKKKFWK